MVWMEIPEQGSGSLLLSSPWRWWYLKYVALYYCRTPSTHPPLHHLLPRSNNLNCEGCRHHHNRCPRRHQVHHHLRKGKGNNLDWGGDTLSEHLITSDLVPVHSLADINHQRPSIHAGVKSLTPPPRWQLKHCSLSSWYLHITSLDPRPGLHIKYQPLC